MSNRKDRRAQQHAQGRYRPPQDLEYNEFVGELRPADGRVFTEMHFRYGVRDDRYLDWSVTLNARLGGVEELRARNNGPLERRLVEVVDVSDSAIRRRVFDPDNPTQLPRITRLVELHPEDHDRVNYEYQNQINHLCVRWQNDHPEIIAVVSRHNTAIMGFLAEDRDVNFRNGESFGWVRNTVVAIDTDLADMVISDRAHHYFPTSVSTAGVLLPGGVMKFIWTSPGQEIPPDRRGKSVDNDSHDGPMMARGDATMGMIVSSIYAGNWTDEVDGLAE